MEVVDLQARPRVPVHSLLLSRATLSKLGTLCAPDDGVFTRRVVVGVRGADTPAWGRGRPAGFSWCFYPPCPARRQDRHSGRGRASRGLGRRRGRGRGAHSVGRPPYLLPGKETGPGPGCTQGGAPSLPPAVSAGGTGRGWEGLLAPPSPDLGLTREVGPLVAPASSARYENRTRMSVKYRRPEHV